MIDVAIFKGRKIFGKKLAKARDAIYLSQEKFATKAGISRGTIARYEGLEVVSISPGSMIKMADALDLPLADLEKKIGAPPDSPTEEWTTIRLPRDLVADLRSAARKRKVNIEEFLAAVVAQANGKGGGDGAGGAAVRIDGKPKPMGTPSRSRAAKNQDKEP